jgi:PAS domain-containing protein
VATRLHAFPSSDVAFAAFVQAAYDGLPEPRTPAALQRSVRARYPAAMVTDQDELARYDTAPPVWYAFRSGAVAGKPEEPVAEWPAHALLDNERRFLEVSEELAAIAELPAAAMLGHHLEEFTNPADPSIREDIERLWVDYLRFGEIASTIRFNYADGRPRELAWWIEADQSGPGRHRLSVRELDG